MSRDTLIKFSKIGLFFAVLCLFVWARPASADSVVTWNLNASFSGGGAASGSFVYDATTNAYTSINITAGGAAFGDGTYTTLDPGFGSSSILLVIVQGILGDFTGAPVLAFDFTSPLTDAGGTVNLGTDHGIQQCGDSTCSVSSLVSAVVTGTVVSSVSTTPEPSSLLLLATGLFGFGLFVRRQR